MWHEARKREKATQKLFKDHKKRAEKRREENRVDPKSLLQVHGIKSKLSLEPNIYKQANKSLVAWQGDKNVTIDRYDVRATLSALPKNDSAIKAKKSGDKAAKNASVVDADENSCTKKLLSYERYRLLLQNDLNKISESLRLKMVAESEMASDMKMKKLMSNRFGTAGVAIPPPGSQLGYSSLSSDNKPHQSKRDNSMGPTYNAVPPPPSLTRSGPEARMATDSSSTLRLLELVDSEDFDKFDIETVDHSKFDSKRIGEVAPKYGLSHEEFTFLSSRDKDDYNSHSILKDFNKLLKRIATNSDPSRPFATKGDVYGPELPPELIRTTSQKEPSQSPASSNGSSPVRQRSPRADIPMRGGSRSPISRKSSHSASPVHLRRSESPDQTKPLPSVVRGDSLQLAQMTSNGNSNGSKQNSDDSKRESLTRADSLQERPRAATPLAYKRHRRSSRSMSRERNRRHERHRHDRHRSSHRRQSRSRSRSRTSSHSLSRRKKGHRSRRYRSSSSDGSSSIESRSRRSDGSPKRSRSTRHRQ